MEFTLYRRMSVNEAEKTLSSVSFWRPEEKLQLTRKWFSTSLFKSHYFRNPFYTGDSVIMKVDINEGYFKQILREGKFLKSEPNGFYGTEDEEEAYLYARAHRSINDLYNIGVLNLEEFNRHVQGLSLMDGDNYVRDLEMITLGKEIDTLVNGKEIERPTDFYLQVPIDVAILMLRYQTLLVEGITLKVSYFSKNLQFLEKVNFGRSIATLRVRFDAHIKHLRLFDEKSFGVDKIALMKLLPYVEEVSLVQLKEHSDIERRDFLELKGDNDFSKHERRVYHAYEYISYESFEKVSKLLVRGGFELESVEPYIGRVVDVYGVMQVDPRQIDGLKTHIEKMINISNLVINYFQSVGIELSIDEVIRVKWTLLVNCLGKPYCECNNITSRYSQFGGYSGYTEKIVNDLLPDDFGFEISLINKVMDIDATVGQKKVNALRRAIIGYIGEYYGVGEEEASKRADQLMKLGFICKVSQHASMKMKRFASNYIDDLGLVKRMETSGANLGIDYEDLYFDHMNAYKSIVENYYVDRIPTTKEMVWGVLQSNYADLVGTYEAKNNYVHHLDDAEQIDYDTLITTYFKEDDSLLSEYFTSGSIDRSIHGQSHSSRVAVYSYLIGKLLGLEDTDLKILLEASKYHDVGRIDDAEDTKHGELSVRKLKESGIILGNDEYVHFLMHSHCVGDCDVEKCMSIYSIDRDKALSLWQVFKDSDALDRVRFDTEANYGSRLNVKLLRTDQAKKLVKFAYLLNAQYKRDIRELNPSVSKLILSK